MAKQVKITFEKIDSTAAAWMLEFVEVGKTYTAVVYGPDEVDDRGNAGCGLDYYVFTDDAANRVGYAKAAYDRTVFQVTA